MFHEEAQKHMSFQNDGDNQSQKMFIHSCSLDILLSFWCVYCWMIWLARLCCVCVVWVWECWFGTWTGAFVTYWFITTGNRKRFFWKTKCRGGLTRFIIYNQNKWQYYIYNKWNENQNKNRSLDYCLVCRDNCCWIKAEVLQCSKGTNKTWLTLLAQGCDVRAAVINLFFSHTRECTKEVLFAHTGYSTWWYWYYNCHTSFNFWYDYVIEQQLLGLMALIERC